MIDPDIPPPVVQALGARWGIIAIRKLEAGLSGGTVAHCRSAVGQEYALKRWPSSTSPERIESIHRVVIHACDKGMDIAARPLNFQSGVRGLPSGPSGTLFSWADENWELSTWRPGNPATVNADLETIHQGAQMIAQFHECTASLESRHQPAPIIRERLQVLAARRQQLPLPVQWVGRVDLDAELAAALRDAANLLQWKWDEAHDQINRSLNQYHDCSLATQYVLRDVHAQHILFSEGQATGLIDFDAVRIDTPASDLARWAGSFLSGRQPTGDVWKAAIAGYRSKRVLNTSNEPLDVRLAKDLCFAGTWLSLANWLVWLLVDQRDFATPPGALAERIRNLIRSASPGSWPDE